MTIQVKRFYEDEIIDAAKDAQTEGWFFEEQTEDTYILSRPKKQSFWIHLVLLLLTFGIGNLFYIRYCNKNLDELHLKLKKHQKV